MSAASRSGATASPLKPLLVTMGDPAGIGPEIIVKAHAQGHAHGCVVIGDPGVLRRAGAPMTAVLDGPGDMAAAPPGCLPVIVPPDLPATLADLPPGRIDSRNGLAAACCIRHAVVLTLAGEALAIVTAPIHKEALAAAGVPFPGHTEMLQSLAAAGPVRMMLANDELRVVLVSIHVSLRQAIDAVSFDAVLSTIRIAHRAAAGWGQSQPRIAVAGLNPHAGEGGLFGSEEQQFIAPAVHAACAEGIAASGPFAPDTVFMRARRGEFDVVVAMTHDHGLIPVKYLGVDRGVNVTLGLPFVRTSPDHGTAFDIAGHGVADASSLVAALAMARRLTAATSSAGPAGRESVSPG